LEEVKAVKSCADSLRVYVERYVSARERVRIMLDPLRDLIGEGLKRGTPKAKLLSIVNESEELAEGEKITESQFRRYLEEVFPDLPRRGLARWGNHQRAQAAGADDFRQSVTRTIEERRNRV
jgi:hypothetical protein